MQLADDLDGTLDGVKYHQLMQADEAALDNNARNFEELEKRLMALEKPAVGAERWFPR
jgi:hypothetical protein